MPQIVFLLLLLFTSQAWSAVEVKGIRLWAAPDNTRVVFDTSAAVKYELLGLSNPPRLVVDIEDARLLSQLPQPKASNHLIRGLRAAKRGSGLRVVLDLHQDVKPKIFTLPPNRAYGHRLVLDVFDPLAGRDQKKPKSVESLEANQGVRDIVIAIDAGHGGEDPGATGASGKYEKHAVLAIAKRVERLVKQEQGMRPVLVRTGDYYIGLRKRIKIAREARADLFMSIHADAFNDPRVHGASVYALSGSGATSEAARWLAERENAADLIGGVKLEDKDDLLASVLLDLSQTVTIESSLEVADELVMQMKPLGKMHKRRPQQAGFVVLKSPDIPSVLIETGFISSPKDEKRLFNPNEQEKLAKAMMKSIRNYFIKHPPPGTSLGIRKHVVQSGDTLSEIAARYHVNVRDLRSVNRLKGHIIRVGQELTIPERQ